MRVGKKHNKVVDVRQTRSCVVRLEKVSTGSPSVSPSSEENRVQRRGNRFILPDMVSTPRGRKAGLSSQKEDKASSSTTKKKMVSGTSNFQTLNTQKNVNISTSNIRPNPKLKGISKSNKSSTAFDSSREESPPPTIAAGRSRRAIKPNPKYASEDMVTPKVVRNVGSLGTSASRGSTGQNKTRKASTSSDDFYNRNSEDEYENFGSNNKNDNIDEYNDKAYQVSEKDELDSDFSVIEEVSTRLPRSRGRQKRSAESTQALSPQIDSKLPTQTRSTTTVVANSSNIRSAPSQLHQIRRSLASATSQRNINLLVGTSGSSQKRKLEEVEDSSDNESNYSLKRKQILISTSSGQKVKLPTRESKVSATPVALTKNRLMTQSQVHKTHAQQAINGSNKINNVMTSSRKAIEEAVKSNSETVAKSSLKHSIASANIIQNSLTTQAKLLASKTQKLRSGSPKLTMQKEKQNNGAVISLSSGSSSSSSSLKTNNKAIEKAKNSNSQSALKPKTIIPPHNSKSIRSEILHKMKDDSPNSTMDDFETMPTFTIVNVNDIISKKGDVLITKSKSINSKIPTVIEFSESISLDDDDDDDNDANRTINEADLETDSTRKKQTLSKKPLAFYNKNEIESKKSPMSRLGESSRKFNLEQAAPTSSAKQAPHILNHKLGLRNSAKATTTLSTTLTAQDKPAPRILNSVVARKTQPVKPLIANMDDSADESFPLSLDEDDEVTEDEIEKQNLKPHRMASRSRKRNYQHTEVDTEDTESQNTEEDYSLLQNPKSTATQISGSQIAALGPKQDTSLQRRRCNIPTSNTPITVSSNKKRLTPVAAKENSLAATNRQVNDSNTKQQTTTLPVRKPNTEKIVISKQGDKIIKKITCFETWYVINMPAEPKRPTIMKNQLEMPLIQLANIAKNICLPNNMWSNKVTLYELSPQSLTKGTFITYTGDLREHNISEEDRGKYQPSCVMFRRSIEQSQPSRMPYDRAVIFKNKTFYTNIEGKNIRLLGAPSIINCGSEIEILLQIVDSLTLQSDFVELISVMQ